MKKIIKLQFKATGEEYYFSNVVSIYDKFDKQDIGVVIGSIWNQFNRKGFYDGAKVKVHAYPVYGKKHR